MNSTGERGEDGVVRRGTNGMASGSSQLEEEVDDGLPGVSLSSVDPTMKSTAYGTGRIVVACANPVIRIFPLAVRNRTLMGFVPLASAFGAAGSFWSLIKRVELK